jgi:uridine phosphorylase
MSKLPGPLYPILAGKHYGRPSAFLPENLLREARRQKGLSSGEVPPVCVLDPDGDIVRHLRRMGRAKKSAAWACYHTDLYLVHEENYDFGIAGCAVGASFAVLVAEQLFASGCQFLISITSAGQLQAAGQPPYFVLIEKALRDEGTSYHYMPPSEFSHADPSLQRLLMPALTALAQPVIAGAVWTTDAPYRETEEAIAAMKFKGLLAVEMEAAALYAFASARQKPVVCFAHVTNHMARVESDFEKGEAGGSHGALAIIRAAAGAFLKSASRRTAPHFPRHGKKLGTGGRDGKKC